MNIPNFENTQFTEYNGYLTAPWQLILQQLITQMQKNLSNEGFIPPQQTATTIASLQSQYQAMTVAQQAALGGNLIYDSTNNVLKVFILNATPTLSAFQTVQSM